MKRVVLALFIAALALSPTAAQAHHDDPKPVPTELKSSQPGGYPLAGFHHDRLSTNCHSWSGLQMKPNVFRLWKKVSCGGRSISVQFRELRFVELGYGEYRACYSSACTRNGTTVYYVGSWHSRYSEEIYYVRGNVKATIYNGASTGGENVASYDVFGTGHVAGDPRT